MNSKAIIIALTTTLLLSGCSKRPVNANPNSSATPPTPNTASQTSDESATARKRPAAVGAPPEPAGYRGFDIHGFRLGMTRREVEANAKKTLSSFAVSHEEATMAASQSYADDPIHPYLSQLEFRNGDLRLYFSPPPRGGRVVGIVLVEQGLDAEPLASAGAYKAALTRKYGQPQVMKRAYSTAPLVAIWHLPSNAKHCVPDKDLTTMAGGELVVTGTEPFNFVAAPDPGYSTFFTAEMRQTGTGDDPTQCSAALTYQIHGSLRDPGDDSLPASRATATLIDFGAAAKAQIANRAWINQRAPRGASVG